MTSCRYTRARTVEEAVAALAEAEGEANVIAGGVALGILMNERLLAPEWLIDIARIDAMKGIAAMPGGGLRIGALTTHTEVERSAAVAAACPLLTEMAAEIACGRIRNRGTVGGTSASPIPRATRPWPSSPSGRACARPGRGAPATSPRTGSSPTSTRRPSKRTSCWWRSRCLQHPPMAVWPTPSSPPAGPWTTHRPSA